MKFKMTFLSLLIFSGVCSAQSFTTSYGLREATNGTDLTSTGLSVAFKVAEKMNMDLAIANLQDRVKYTNGLRTEIGLTYSQPINQYFTGSVRVSHGFKSNSGKETIQYYNIEPGVTAKLGNSPFSVRVAYRYRNAYDVSDNDRSDTNRVAVRYQMTKKDSFSLGYDNQTGSGAAKQTTLSYTRAF